MCSTTAPAATTMITRRLPWGRARRWAGGAGIGQTCISSAGHAGRQAPPGWGRHAAAAVGAPCCGGATFCPVAQQSVALGCQGHAAKGAPCLPVWVWHWRAACRPSVGPRAARRCGTRLGCRACFSLRLWPPLRMALPPHRQQRRLPASSGCRMRLLGPAFHQQSLLGPSSPPLSTPAPPCR